MKPIQINKPENLYAPAKGEFKYFFPTPVFRGVFEHDYVRIRDDIDRLIEKSRERHGANREANYTTYFDPDLRQETNQLSWFKDFANCMKDTYVQFIRTQYNHDTSYLKRSDIHFFAWLNKYTNEHQHNVHDHTESTVSGTFYLDGSPNRMPIHFLNPAHSTIFSHSPVNEMVDHQDGFKTMAGGTTETSFEFHAQEGDFLLWPSYLLHYVPRSAEPDPDYMRYSISFNLTHNKPLGDTNHGTELAYGFLDND